MEGKIITTKGEFDYQYAYFDHEHLKAYVHHFHVWKEGDGIDSMYRFSFMLRVMEDGNDLKVVDMYAFAYKGQGISIALLLHAKQLFGKRIISSSNKYKTFSGEQRWPDADNKVWNPLIQQGLAGYDPELDVYYLL